MIRNFHNNQRGFTLIEIMVVVVILGLLVAIVAPKFLGREEQAQKTRAALDIKGIEEALALFKLDNGFFPGTDQGLQALVRKPETGRIPAKYADNAYLKKVPSDPWGREYVYLSPGAHDAFDIISYGADGEPGGEGNDADIESWNLD